MNKRVFELYFIMGTTNVEGKDPLVVLEAALRGGATCFQLREKGPGALTGEERMEFARECKQLCAQYQVPFIINDDVGLALEVGADGVHIGQDDGEVTSVRKKIGSTMLLGVSTHNLAEALAAADAGADYIGIGPVYSTMTKTDTQPVTGTDVIREVTSLLPGLPMVGIGGISERKARAVIRAGASGVAVISAISKAEDPEDAARRLKGSILLSLTGVEM